MKLLIISFALVIGVFSAPHSSETNEFVTEDDIGMKVISKALKNLNSLAADNDIAAAVVKSIDKQCMLNKYKKHNLSDGLTEEVLDISNISEETPVDPFIVFANIALTCSSKLHALLGFVFDNLFSYSGLLDAFREDEPFKEFIDDLVCYNNFAVQSNILDPAIYSHLNYNLTNQTQEECDETIIESRKSMVDTLDFFSEFVVSDHKKCLQNEISAEGEKFFLRYALLIPAGLTDDQKRETKSSFISDALDGLEKLLVCNSIKADPADPKNNEISQA